MIERFFNPSVYTHLLAEKYGSYLTTEPYPYVVIPEILDNNFFYQARKKCQLLLENLTKLESFNIYHAHLNVPELLSIFCSSFFIEHVGNIFRLNVIRKRDHYPSLRVLPKGGSNLHIHNDMDFIGNIVMFLYLSDWEEGCGGEIGIYKKNNHQFIRLNQIKPLPNTLFIMPITDTKMYHAIQPTAENYIRQCAYFPLTIL